MKKKEYHAPEVIVYTLDATDLLYTSKNYLSEVGPEEETERGY